MLIIRVQILNIDDMYNYITGQTTDDIIAIIKLHGKFSIKIRAKDHCVSRNIAVNRVNRRIFNHNFNRNKYVRSK